MADGCKMMNIMKKFISNLIFATFVALGLASCTKVDKNVEKISGEWYWQGTEADVDLEIYLAFNKDNTFDLFQKIGDGAFRHYTGTFNFDGKTLNGVYSDKTAWRYSYEALVDGNNLTLSYIGEERSLTYVRKSIPFTVKQHHTEPLKSMADENIPFL
jgi:hypothetical protein